MNESLAQHTFALSMNKDNFLSLLFLIFLHGLLEDIHLIMKNICRIHSSSCFKYFIRMKIYHKGTIILLALLLAGVGDNLLILIHLLFQTLGIDNQRTGYFIVLYNRKEIGWSLEEIVLLEKMKFVEFHGIETELNICCRLQEKWLVLLVSYHLDGDMLHLVQSLTTEFLDEEFGVRFYFSLCFQSPCISLSHEIGIVEIVVAVIHHIGLETGIGYVLDVDRYKGEISTEFVATRTFLYRFHKGYLTVGSIIFLYIHIHVIVIIQDGLDTPAVLMQFGIGMLLSLLLRIHFSRNHLAHGVFILLHHNYLVDRHRNLKTILILNEHNIFTLEAGNLSATHFAQESDFISFFHNLLIICNCKDTKDIAKQGLF